MANIQALQALAVAAGKKQAGELLMLQLMDFQGKHNFDVIFYPTYFPVPSANPNSIALAAKAGICTAMDQMVTRLNIQGITIPTFNTLEMENADIEQYIKSLTRATEVTFTFIEVEQSLIINYLKLWNDLIYFYDPISKTYIFRDDQYAAKKNCKIFLNTRMGIPSNAYLTITGMRPKSTGELTLAQDDQEPYKPEVTFHCDRIDWSF